MRLEEEINHIIIIIINTIFYIIEFVFRAWQPSHCMIMKQVWEIENENCVSELQNDAAKLLYGKIVTH